MWYNTMGISDATDAYRSVHTCTRICTREYEFKHQVQLMILGQIYYFLFILLND